MSRYQVRYSAPAADNPYYIHTSKGGYNPAILIGGDSVLPNCVGYANGRLMEWGGVKRCEFPLIHDAACAVDDAKNYGLRVGQRPAIGAVMCWSGGMCCYGHVAFVEQVIDEQTVIITDSAYGGDRFRRYKITSANQWGKGGAYHFLGFIYNPYANNKAVLEFRARMAAGKLTKSYDYSGDGHYGLEDLLLLRKAVMMRG